MSTQPTGQPVPSIEEYARQLVDNAPPLSTEQQDRIRGLFAPAVAELAEPQDRKKSA
jgi:hypothetical protein